MDFKSIIIFFLSGISIIFLFFLPYIFLGEDSYVIVHDNLDAAVPAYKFISESNMLFSPNISSVEGIMGELPRLAHPSEMDFITWLYYWFSPWFAYLINLILIRVIAFASMFLLLLKLTKEQNTRTSLFLLTFFSVLFALLPTWPSAGISVAGQPLVIYLFILISEGNKKVWPFIILLLYTFYSSLVLSGLFLGIGIFLWFVYHCIRRESFDYKFFIGFLILIAGYIIADYRLLLSVIDPINYGFLSHRTEMDPVLHSNPFGNFINFLFNGHYHAAKLPIVFGIIVIAATPFVLILNRRNHPLIKILLWSVFATAFLSAIAKWENVAFIYKNFSFLKTFQIDRFFFLIPTLVIMTIYLLYFQYRSSNKYIKILGGIILIMALLDIVWMDMNYRNLAKNLLGWEVRDPTYKEFFAEDVFLNIKEEIPYEDKVFLNFGIHPSVAQFNGLITQDGYTSNYPLTKKYHFLNMLGSEWKENNKESFTYIQDWGSRLYILQDKFTDQVRYKWGAEADLETELQLNWDYIKASGVQYLLSTNPILDEEISLVEVFEDQSSAWKIFLYHL